MYIRFQAAVPNERGTYPGVFALTNGLAKSGALSDEDELWWRASNDWGNASYVDPSSVVPAAFDRDLNPGASSWFKISAVELVEYTRGYVSLLKRYDVHVAEVLSADPGTLVYEDDVQIVAVPRRE